LDDLDGTEVILIDELRCWRDIHALDKPALRRVLGALGDEAARYLENVLNDSPIQRRATSASTRARTRRTWFPILAGVLGIVRNSVAWASSP
jgi:hypothetical protein